MTNNRSGGAAPSFSEHRPFCSHTHTRRALSRSINAIHFVSPTAETVQIVVFYTVTRGGMVQSSIWQNKTKTLCPAGPDSASVPSLAPGLSKQRAARPLLPCAGRTWLPMSTSRDGNAPVTGRNESTLSTRAHRAQVPTPSQGPLIFANHLEAACRPPHGARLSGSPQTLTSPQFCSFCDRTVTGPTEDSLALGSEHTADRGLGGGGGGLRAGEGREEPPGLVQAR